jgi:predicted nucleotidyltransferase component of viral defense system
MLDRNSIYYKQAQLLLEVLPYVSQEKCFTLKGGTAINMFIRDMPRLSVDIDLMYLPVEDRQISLQNIALSFERIARLIESSIRGTKVHRLYQRSDETLSKLQIEKNSVRIKIEASPVIRGTVREPSILSVSARVEEEFGFAETSVVHLDDLYAGKICAALDRQHPRDFFDLRGLLDNEGISDTLMDVFVVYLISSNQPISKLLQPNLIDIERIYAEQFAGMPIEPISLDILEHTRVELISIIHSRLTQNHRDFLIGFKEGTPDWSLLPFESIDELPSVKWKMLNLGKMPKKKRDEATQKLKGILQTP